MKFSSKYVNLSELDNEFRSGFIIIGDTLFEVDDLNVVSFYQLYGETVEEKVISARINAEIDGRTRIVFDDEQIYDEETVSDSNRLVTLDDIFEDEAEEEHIDWDSAFEHFMDN